MEYLDIYEILPCDEWDSVCGGFSERMLQIVGPEVWTRFLERSSREGLQEDASQNIRCGFVCNSRCGIVCRTRIG